jgi:YhcH/YjgK/YiaL family protein
MALFGSLAARCAQAPQTPRFAAALAHAEELLRPGSPAQARIRGIAAGGSNRVDLADGVFAIEQVYETRPRVDGFFESHRKYIDLQVVIEGEEAIEVIDAARIAVRDPFDPERDLVTYADTAEASRLRLGAGLAAIFFPVDVHMPTLRVAADPVLVRKVVVKIPVG